MKERKIGHTDSPLYSLYKWNEKKETNKQTKANKEKIIT